MSNQELKVMNEKKSVRLNRILDLVLNLVCIAVLLVFIIFIAHFP